jgi:regulator of protease activity HflC (stomatin/prohibitin superfamily)
MKVTDTGAATNNITDYKMSVIQLATATMRNAIGSIELDEFFQSRDSINATILRAMTRATQPWGVMVTLYEIKDISPPQSIREDMEKQMTAEREKRSVILTAQGFKTATITDAEGLKVARVLDATSKAEAIRLVAEADANAIALVTIDDVANTPTGEAADLLNFAQDAIAPQSTVVLTVGKTSDNIANTVAQAIAVSSSLKLHGQSSEG